MRPFNLEEYLKNPSRKIITRDGRKVTRILCTNVKSALPVVALIKESNGKGEQVCSFTKNGNFCQSEETRFDLFFAPEKHEGWVNIYKTSEGWSSMYNIYSYIYPTEEEAKKVIGGDYITTVKIEWEEQI